jgi:hypothetical protein
LSYSCSPFAFAAFHISSHIFAQAGLDGDSPTHVVISSHSPVTGMTGTCHHTGLIEMGLVNILLGLALNSNLSNLCLRVAGITGVYCHA